MDEILQRIYEYCLWCSFTTKDVRKCDLKDCPLFPFRMGRHAKGKSAHEAVFKKCFNCGNGTLQSIKKCDFKDCPLFAYKRGFNPKLMIDTSSGSKKKKRK